MPQEEDPPERRYGWSESEVESYGPRSGMNRQRSRHAAAKEIAGIKNAAKTSIGGRGTLSPRRPIERPVFGAKRATAIASKASNTHKNHKEPADQGSTSSYAIFPALAGIYG